MGGLPSVSRYISLWHISLVFLNCGSSSLSKNSKHLLPLFRTRFTRNFEIRSKFIKGIAHALQNRWPPFLICPNVLTIKYSQALQAFVHCTNFGKEKRSTAVACTRFQVPGSDLSPIPIGPSTPLG